MLKMFHNYCFAREVSIITDHKPLVAIFKKDVAGYHREYNKFFSEYTNTESYTSLGQICSYQIGFPDKTTRKANAQKYPEYKSFNIDAMQITTNIPECMTIHKATSQGEHLQCLKEHIIHG